MYVILCKPIIWFQFARNDQLNTFFEISSFFFFFYLHLWMNYRSWSPKSPSFSCITLFVDRIVENGVVGSGVASRVYGIALS